MKVRDWFDKVLSDNGTFTSFLINGRRIILRNNLFKFGKTNSIIIEKSLAYKNSLRWKLLLHIPPYIAPQYNQKCIYELEFRSEECGRKTV